MARSIHTTKKHLKQERFFAASDGVPWGPDATELEINHIKKLLHKDNKVWRREADKRNLPFVAEIKLKNGKVVRTLLKKRAPKPASPTEQSAQWSESLLVIKRNRVV